MRLVRKTATFAISVIAFAACSHESGSGLPAGEITSQPVPGTRLRPQLVTTGDGFEAFLGWLDTTRNEPCEIALATDQTYRCLPLGLCTSPEEGLSHADVGRPTYTCLRAMCGGAEVHAAFALPPTDFVEVTREAPAANDGPLAPVRFTGKDGSEGVLGLFDTAGGFDCSIGRRLLSMGDVDYGQPSILPDNDGTHCVPMKVPAVKRTYLERACSSEVAYADASCGADMVLRLHGNDAYKDPYEIVRLGDAMKGESWNLVPNGPHTEPTMVCVKGDPVDGRRATSTVVSFQSPAFVDEGTTRLHAHSVVLANGHRFRTAFIDTRLGEACTFRDTAKGLRCLPAKRSDGYAISQYADPACTDPVLLVEDAKADAIRWIGISEFETGVITSILKPRPERYTGTLYEKDGSCRKSNSNCEGAGCVQRALRFEVVDLETFELGTKSTR